MPSDRPDLRLKTLTWLPKTGHLRVHLAYPKSIKPICGWRPANPDAGIFVEKTYQWRDREPAIGGRCSQCHLLSFYLRSSALPVEG